MSPTETEPDDDALVAAFQAGDPRAFDALVVRHRRRIYATCRGILRDHAQADEACQDAFVKAWQGLPGFKGESSFRTWLHRIGMNAAFDLRTRELAQARNRDAAAHERPVEPRHARPGDALQHEEELALLRKAVDGLPDRQRTTLLMKVQQELKYTEIGEILDCPVGTAKANFHHAVQNLRRALVAAGLVPDPDAAAWAPPGLLSAPETARPAAPDMARRAAPETARPAAPEETT